MVEKFIKLIVDAANNSIENTKSLSEKIVPIKDGVMPIVDTLSNTLKSDSIKQLTAKIGSIKDSDLAMEAVKRADSFKKKLNELFTDISGPLLSEQTIYKGLLEYFEKIHTHVGESEAVKAAIDGLAHVKGYGGGQFHRLVDGRHSVMGAIDVIGTELPKTPYHEKVSEALHHLWADFNSRSGIAVFTFDNMDQFKNVCSTLHLSPSFLKDFLTVNSTEMLSSALTIIPILFRMDEMQAADFAKAATRIGIYTAAGSQFELLGSLFSLSMLGKAFFDASHSGESLVCLLKESAQEGGWVGAAMTSVAILPFPFSIAAPIFLSVVRSRVETEGIDGVIQSSSEYFDEFYKWVRLEGLEKLRAFDGEVFKSSIEKLIG